MLKKEKLDTKQNTMAYTLRSSATKLPYVVRLLDCVQFAATSGVPIKELVPKKKHTRKKRKTEEC